MIFYNIIEVKQVLIFHVPNLTKNQASNLLTGPTRFSIWTVIKITDTAAPEEVLKITLPCWNVRCNFVHEDLI